MGDIKGIAASLAALHGAAEYRTIPVMPGAASKPYVFVSHASADNARLRPLLAAMLEARIPLWFDKPEHVDIQMDPASFHGSIGFGQTWRSTVLDAIDGACAVLTFPSESASKSREVMRETGFTQAQCRERGAGMMFMSALLSPDDASSEADFTSGIRSFSTFVTPGPDGRFNLTPAGLLDAQNLIAQFQLHLAKQTGAAGKTAQAPAPPPRDYPAPFLVDRTAQRDIALAAFTDPLRPPVFVIHGPDQEAPNRFTTINLLRQVVGGRGFFKSSAATSAPLRPRWPADGGAQGQALHLSFARTLLDKLQGGDAVEDIGVWKSLDGLGRLIGDGLFKDGVTRMVVTRIEAAAFTTQRLLQTVDDWTGFWDNFPFKDVHLDGQFLLIPVLEIVHRAPADRKWWSSLSADPAEMIDAPKLARGLQQKYARISPHVLPALPSITPSCARDWVANDDLFAHRSELDREDLASALCRLFEAKAPGDQLAMREWAALSQPVLLAAGIQSVEA